MSYLTHSVIVSEGSEMSEDIDTQHPALKKAGFNSTTTAIGSTAKKTLFGALKGAVIGGLIIGGAVFISGAAVTAIPVVGWLLGGAALGTGLAGGALATAAIAGATWGGAAGAAVGLVKGITGAEDAVSERREEIIADYERAQINEQRTQIMSQRRQMQQMAMMQQGASLGGVTPSLPMGASGMGGPGVGIS